MLRTLAAAALLAFATVAHAAVVTYDLTASGGDYFTGASSSGPSGYLVLPDPAPRITGGVTLHARFAIDTDKAVYNDSGADPIWQSTAGDFIGSTITTSGSTPGLGTTLTGSSGASWSNYDAAFHLLDVTGFGTYSPSGTLLTSTVDYYEHYLFIFGGFTLTDFGNIQLPTEFAPGASFLIISRRSTQSFENDNGIATFGQIYREARGTGTFAENGNAISVESGMADVPEPAALGILGLGILGVAARRRRRG